MKKSKKWLLRIVPVFLVLAVVLTTSVFAYNDLDLGNLDTGTEKIDTATIAANKIWNTIAVILQIAAVAAIVVAGVRYMFASADGKADIKKQTIGLVVGAILVFAASYVVTFVTKIAQGALT